MAHLAQCMQELEYHPCDPDPDMWMKDQYRPEDKVTVLIIYLMLCG